MRFDVEARKALGVAMHADQLPVSVDTVRELVADQFPEWVEQPIKEVDSTGTVNALFRIGDHLVARLPLVPQDVGVLRQQIEAEANAARELLGRTRFATPEPVAIGSPGDGYPLPWSVQTWVPGTAATDVDPGASTAFAHDLAEFIQGVRTIDTRGRTFTGSGRGGSLRDHDEWMETCFQRSERLLDVPRLRRIWSELRELPRTTSVDVMTHGDLIPGNVLVDGGRLTGIIDVGGLGPADPALDLVSAWHLLDADPRHVLRHAVAADDVEWERGKAWAFEQAIGAAWYYVDSNPAMSLMGQRTLVRIMEAS